MARLSKGQKRRKDHRQRLMAKTGGLCLYCGRVLTADPRKRNQRNYCTFDHFIPRAKLGGKCVSSNKVASCRDCNEIKGDLMPFEYMELLETSL